MKKISFILLGLLVGAQSVANINFIDIKLISQNAADVASFNSIKDNQRYYAYWTHEWRFDRPKATVTNELKAAYAHFSSMTAGNSEWYLLLGEIAHFLYNLDVNEYHKLAVDNYENAIRLKPNDYRGFWFLAFHNSMAAMPLDAAENFLRAQAMLPNPAPPEFWHEYAFSLATSNMPIHAVYGMDQVRKLTGKPGYLEEQLGGTIRGRIRPIDQDSSYRGADLWNGQRGIKNTFTCRPMGIRISIDSAWGFSPLDYQNRKAFCLIKPPRLTSKSGRQIGFSIMVAMMVPREKEKIDDFLQLFISKYRDKKRIEFSRSHTGLIAYEIRDPEMYKEIGGGHMYLIGLERKKPEYPGLTLESPLGPPKNELNGQVAFYAPMVFRDRFADRIFYAFMLDSCEDIHAGSIAAFTDFFENGVLME